MESYDHRKILFDVNANSRRQTKCTTVQDVAITLEPGTRRILLNSFKDESRHIVVEDFICAVCSETSELICNIA